MGLSAECAFKNTLPSTRGPYLMSWIIVYGPSFGSPAHWNHCNNPACLTTELIILLTYAFHKVCWTANAYKFLQGTLTLSHLTSLRSGAYNVHEYFFSPHSFETFSNVLILFIPYSFLGVMTRKYQIFYFYFFNWKSFYLFIFFFQRTHTQIN